MTLEIFGKIARILTMLEIRIKSLFDPKLIANFQVLNDAAATTLVPFSLL